MNTHKLLVSVLMLISVLLSACAPVATPPAPTAVPATVAPTIAPASTLTTFSSKTFDLPITFFYGPEWKIDSEYSNQVSLTIKDSDEYFSFIDPKTARIAGPTAPYSVMPFPDDFVNWIQAHGLFHVVKTQSVIVGGLPGTQIDAETTSACGTNPSWLFAGTGGWRCGLGGYYRFVYMENVNGERLLIMIEGFSAEDFTLKVDAAQKVLDTVVFTKP